MLGCMFPKYTSVTAKKSLKFVPLLGWFMALSKTVFIDRANRTSSRAAFDTAAHTMKTTRQNVFIFLKARDHMPQNLISYPSRRARSILQYKHKFPLCPSFVVTTTTFWTSRARDSPQVWWMLPSYRQYKRRV